MPMPPLMPPIPESVEIPSEESPETDTAPVEQPNKKGKWLRRILLLLVLSIVGAGGAQYAGFVDLTEYLPVLEEYLP